MAPRNLQLCPKFPQGIFNQILLMEGSKFLQISQGRIYLRDSKLFWLEIKTQTGVKVPVLHPNSSAVDMIQGKVIKESDACIILCGCWAD